MYTKDYILKPNLRIIFLPLLHSNHGYSKSFPTELSFSQRDILGTQGEIICFMKRLRIFFADYMLNRSIFKFT